MNDASTVERLSAAIGQSTRSARFCAVGCLAVADPGIEVEGLGTIRFPLKRTTAKDLVATCQVAPYGKGVQTLVNKKVRNTFELDPKEFRLSAAWNAAITDAMRPVAEQLGLPADQLEARLYKLLVYEKGGFFLPHRDSEKDDRMVASLIVVLPNPFGGGALVIRHGTAKQQLKFEQAATGKVPCYAAFYADCQHEVERVTSGVRMSLAYNLVLKPKRGKRSAAANRAAPVDVLAASIGSWIAQQPETPLVFALEHHYTQRGLSLDLLKGVDRQLADLIVAAAEKMDCTVHLAQVSRHLAQFADDGSFSQGYSHSYRTPRHAIEIGETYEDDLNGTEWTDIEGRRQPWGDIAFDPASIVSSVPIDDWKPTSEEFEGYTGNAGNTLDRWYHRSAIVIWHRDQHFTVVASSGAADSIPLFCSMAAKLTGTSTKQMEQLRVDCIRFARAIIARWQHNRFGYGNPAPRDESPYDDFPKNLLALNDRDTIAMFLMKLAERDQSLRLSSFVVAACREFGSSAFSLELKHLISAQPTVRGQHEIPFRDVEWISAFCCDPEEHPDKSALARELCALAVERFCDPAPARPTYDRPDRNREASVSEKSLPLLLKALVASEREDDLARVIRFVRQSPDEFGLDACQVPSLKSLIPWSRKRSGSDHPHLVSWLFSVRTQLESATATRPAPPADWARPAEVACQCAYCAELNAFLADPTSQVGRIAAREDARQHLINRIDRHQCDVKSVLERKGSPYSLVLTKTTGSFERAVKRFEADCRLLGELPAAESHNSADLS